MYVVASSLRSSQDRNESARAKSERAGPFTRFCGARTADTHDQLITFAQGEHKRRTHQRDDGPVLELFLPGHELVPEPLGHDAPRGPVEHTSSHDRDPDEAVEVVWQRRGVAHTVRGRQERRDDDCNASVSAFVRFLK